MLLSMSSVFGVGPIAVYYSVRVRDSLDALKSITKHADAINTSLRVKQARRYGAVAVFFIYPTAAQPPRWVD